MLVQNRNSNGNFLSCEDFVLVTWRLLYFDRRGGGGGYMSIFRAARSVIEVTYCCVKDSEGGGMTKPGRSPPWRLNYRNI